MSTPDEGAVPADQQRTAPVLGSALPAGSNDAPAMSESASGTPLRRGWAIRALSAVALLVLGAASTWAAITILRPTEDPLSATEHATVVVKEGTVGSSLNLNTMAEWNHEPIGANRAAGVVTSVAVTAGAEVSPGDTLYTVDLRPVVVAQGSVPMFRAIGQGATGADVRQLQELLRAVGTYKGNVDGRAGEGTEQAISAWQRALEVPATGVVEESDVIFVPSLPARVVLDAAVITRGASLSGGETVLSGLSASPTFAVPVTEAQSTMIPAGTAVQITAPDGQLWNALAAEQVRTDEGAISVRLHGAEDGTPICGTACTQVAPEGKTALPSRIVVVESVDGLVVPSAALVTRVDGAIAVLDSKGREVAVHVVASAKGMSVITGAKEGLRVQIPTGEDIKR